MRHKPIQCFTSVFSAIFESVFRPVTPSATSFTVSLTGLTGGFAIIGDHASISYTITPDNGTDTVKWSNSSDPADPATYGTGAAPTDYTAGDGNPLYCHVTDGGTTVTRSATIAKPVATGGADLDLAFAEDSAISPTDLIQNWTTNGNTLTFVSVSPSLPTGLSINSAGTLSGTPTDVTADDTYTLTMQDAYGRQTADTFTLEITAALVAPTVSSSSYNASTGEVTMAINSTAGDCTVYWATTASGATPTEAQVRAGTGGGILDAGTSTSSAPSDTDTITVTDTTAEELHFVVENAAGDTGTPSGANNTVITGVVVYPAPYAASGVAVPAPSGSTNNYTVDMEPGMNVVSIYSGLGSGASLTSVSLDSNSMTKRSENTVIGAHQPVVQFEYFNAGPKKTSVTLSLVHTSTPFRTFYQPRYLGNVAWVSSATDPASASYTQTNDVSQNTNADDIIVGIDYLRDNSYVAGGTTVTGATKSFDAAVEGTRYAITAHNFAATGGTPETFTFDVGLSPGFEHVAVSDVYRPN